MLGVTTVPFDSPGDAILREYAEHCGAADSFRHTPVAVFFGEPGKEIADPYFDGEGPPRTGCTRCGACMVGCRVGAKNTLRKNYLWWPRTAAAYGAGRRRRRGRAGHQPAACELQAPRLAGAHQRPSRRTGANQQ